MMETAYFGGLIIQICKRIFFYFQEFSASRQVSPEHLTQGLQLEGPAVTYHKTSSRSSKEDDIIKQNVYHGNIIKTDLDLQEGHETQAMLSNNAHYSCRQELEPRSLYDENIATASRKQRSIISGKEHTRSRSTSSNSYVNFEGQPAHKTNFLPTTELTSGMVKKVDKSHEVLGRIQVPATKETSRNARNLYSVTKVDTEFTDTKQDPLLKASGENGHVEINPWTNHETYKQPDQFRFRRTTHFTNTPSSNGNQNYGKFSEHTSQRKRHALPQYAPQTNEVNWKAPLNHPIETNITSEEQTHSSLPYSHQENHNANPVNNLYQSYYNQHLQPSLPTHNHQQEHQSQPSYYSSVPPINPLIFQRLPYIAPITHPHITPLIPLQTPLYESTFQHYTLPQTLQQIAPTLENRPGNIDTPPNGTGYWSKEPSTNLENEYVSAPKALQDLVNQYAIRDLPKDSRPGNQQYDIHNYGLNTDITFKNAAIRNDGAGNPSLKSEDMNVLSSQASSDRILPSETDIQSLNSKYEPYVTGTTHLPLHRLNYQPTKQETIPALNGDNGIFHSKSPYFQEEIMKHPSQVDMPLTSSKNDQVQQQFQSGITEYYTDPSSIPKKRQSNFKSFYKHPLTGAAYLDYSDTPHVHNELSDQEIRQLPMAPLMAILPQQTERGYYTTRDIIQPPYPIPLPNFINLQPYKLPNTDFSRYSTYGSPTNTQMSYPDEYHTNEIASIQNNGDNLGRETIEPPSEDIYEALSGNSENRKTVGGLLKIETPLSFTTLTSQPPSTEILNTGSHNPTDINKSPGAFEKFQTTFSSTQTRQEKPHLVTTEPDPIVTNYQEKYTPPEQDTASRMSRSSAIKGHELLPSSTSTAEPTLSDCTYSVARNVKPNEVPRSIYVSSIYTEEIRETTTVMETTETPQLSPSDRSRRLSLPVGAKNIVIKLPNGEDIIIDIASPAEISTSAIKVSSYSSNEEPVFVENIKELSSASGTEILNASQSTKHPILIVEPRIFSEVHSVPNPDIFPEKSAIAKEKILSEPPDFMQHSQLQTTTEMPSSDSEVHLLSTAAQVSNKTATSSSIFSVTTVEHPVTTLPLNASKDSVGTTASSTVFKSEQTEGDTQTENSNTVSTNLGINFQ
jgi:hypothetical protein